MRGPSRSGVRLLWSVESFVRDKTGPHGESLGHTKLYVNDKIVAQGDMRTQAGKFTLSGDGLCIGRDSGDAGGPSRAARSASSPSP